MKNNRDSIQVLVDTFSTEPVCVADALSDGRFFLDEKYDALSRRLGEVFWLPVSHAYVVFCYAYSALFGIPDFTHEALMRPARSVFAKAFGADDSLDEWFCA